MTQNIYLYSDLKDKLQEHGNLQCPFYAFLDSYLQLVLDVLNMYAKGFNLIEWKVMEHPVNNK